MVEIPPHPAYADPNTPSSKYREIHKHEFIGDPVKGTIIASTLYYTIC